VLTAGWFLARKRIARVAAEWRAVGEKSPDLPEGPEPQHDSDEEATVAIAESDGE
jgi:hypothetical protein